VEHGIAGMFQRVVRRTSKVGPADRFGAGQPGGTVSDTASPRREERVSSGWPGLGLSGGIPEDIVCAVEPDPGLTEPVVSPIISLETVWHKVRALTERRDKLRRIPDVEELISLGEYNVVISASVQLT